MKKRSLFAAVAMLIVSAVVLTSATYAWFAVGGGAGISAITGDVCSSQSGVLLQTLVEHAEWKNGLEYVDLVADTTNNKFATDYTLNGNAVNPGTENAVAAGTYVPISSSDPKGSSSKFAYTVNASHVYTATTISGQTIDDWYDTYTFRVGTVTEGTTPVLARLKIDGLAKAAARVAVYTSTDGGSTWSNPSFYSGGGEGGTTSPNWKPVIATLPNTAADVANSNNEYNYIVDANDTGITDGTHISTNPIVCEDASGWSSDINLGNVHVTGYSNSGTVNTLIKAYVWIEGNDSDCAPTNLNVPGKSISVQWQFKMQGESWPA